jgi:AcrR family transcriptional regulator
VAKKENRKIRYTKIALKESLVELMQRKPISKITITELCELADINRNTFYTYYTSQHDLLRNIEDESLSELQKVLKQIEGKPGKAEVQKYLSQFLHFVRENKNSIQVLLSDKGDLDFQKQLVNTTFSSIYQQSPELAVKEQERKEYTVLYATTGSLHVIQGWLQRKMSMPIDDLANLLLNLTWSSFENKELKI